MELLTRCFQEMGDGGVVGVWWARVVHRVETNLEALGALPGCTYIRVCSEHRVLVCRAELQLVIVVVWRGACGNQDMSVLCTVLKTSTPITCCSEPHVVIKPAPPLRS